MTEEVQRCAEIYKTTEKLVDNKGKYKKSAENVAIMESKWSTLEETVHKYSTMTYQCI